MANKIKFVYFDIGGVAFNFKDAIVALAKHVERPYNDVFEVFKKYDNDICRGKITVEKLWQNYKRDLNLDIDIANFLEWWTDNFTPNKEVHTLMEEVSKKYKIGIVTNVYKGALIKMFEKGHVPKLNYSAIVESHKLGLLKPEKDFFIYAQKLSGVELHEIFFIDDSRENVDLASHLGWRSFLFDDSNPIQSIDKIKEILGLEKSTARKKEKQV